MSEGRKTMLSDVLTGIQVRDVMSSPVKTIAEHETVETAAKLMKVSDLGSIIVTNFQGNPVGVITEKDIITRVVAENRLPSQVPAAEAMSYPVLTTEPNTDIKDAARSMRTNAVRRLVVMEHGRMIGIISSKDIVEITPALIELISEKTKITHNAIVSRRGFISTGYCDKCRQWSDSMRDVNGDFLCEECRLEIEAE